MPALSEVEGVGVELMMIYVPSRVKRHKSKFSIDTGLNLVSLMDIFTILLLFLLIHVSGESEEIPLPEIVSLPASTATARPEPVTTVYVTAKEILVEDKKVADVRDVLGGKDMPIAGLERELSHQAEKSRPEDESKGKVIIMGDKSIPFTLLRRVMNSCARAGYPAITLAVIQKE